VLENLKEENFSSKNAINNAERKVFQTVSSANTVHCCILLAVGCVRKAREKRSLVSVEDLLPNDYGRHVGATSSLGARAREP